MSRKNSFNAQDAYHTAFTAIIFLLPLLVSSQSEVSAYLVAHGFDPQVVSAVFSVLAYSFKKYAEGPDGPGAPKSQP